MPGPPFFVPCNIWVLAKAGRSFSAADKEGALWEMIAPEPAAELKRGSFPSSVSPARGLGLPSPAVLLSARLARLPAALAIDQVGPPSQTPHSACSTQRLGSIAQRWA